MQGRHRFRVLTVGLGIGLLAACRALAAVYYVSLSGNDSYPGTGVQPFLTAQRGFAALGPGDELLFKDGTYGGSGNAFTNLPNGNSGAWITIRAENEGGVIFTAGLQMDDADQYLVIQGLRFQDSMGHSIRGHHLKFFRNEFKGGCPVDNCSAASVGTNDVNTTADILLEDNWFHGPGGRYNLLVYNSSRVVVRRAVVRHDGGWTDTKGDPEAGIQIYNSQDCAVQNSLVLDSNLTYHTWASAFYAVQNNSSPTPNQYNTWAGIIALNVSNCGFMQETGASTGNVLTDAVLWDSNGGASFGGSGNVGNFQVIRATVGTSRVHTGDWGGFGHWGGGTPTVINSVIYNIPCCDLNGVPATFFDTYSNGSVSSGAGQVTYNPLTNGLQYLPRIETGSALKTAGSGGGQIGAQIVKRIGVSGTLYGESGYNTVTTEDLWPFPNEERIKKEMCTDAGVTRGFCGSASLTEYIWDYLGNGNPYPPAAPAPPARPGRLRLQ